MIHFDITSVVPNPTKLTSSYLNSWFTNSPTLDQGLQLLNLPTNKDSSLKSKIQNLYIQSTWLAYPQKTIKIAKNLLETIPNFSSTNPELDLKEIVMPRVIAIGMLTEYFSKAYPNLTISKHMIASDWIFKSISDQYLVKSGMLSFENYISEYSNRADIDYELTCPRWHEITDQILNRINCLGNISHNVSLRNNSTPTDELQIIRSLARKSALIHIDALRKYLNNPQSTIENSTLNINSGPTRGISPGEVSGISLHIKSNFMPVNTGVIGIFPNASPEFTTQFPKCAGIIFLNGGLTSHGAIVAREFGIPAITAPNLVKLPDNTNLSINGSKGTWKLLKA